MIDALTRAWYVLLDIVLTTDRRQRHCLTMFWMGASLMIVGVLAMQIGRHAGLVEVAWIAPWTALSGTGVLLIYVLIRSGFSLRFSDPALTLLQIAYSTTCTALAFLILAEPVRGLTLPVVAVIMMFGMLGLTLRQTVVITFYILIIFGAAVMLVDWPSYPDQKLTLLAVHELMMMVVLVAVIFITQRLHMTRDNLRRRSKELALAVEQIRLLATHDEMTALPNRRYMADLMLQQVQSAQRSGRPLLLVQLDVDHFKRINDTHGHAVGDLVLKSFAQTVRAAIRAADVLSRWGGEEFVLMLRDTPQQEAALLLERIRRAVTAPIVVRQGMQPIHITVSIGAALLRDGESLDDTLERADRALYAAKDAGRDRIVWAD